MGRIRKTWLPPAEMAALLSISKSAVYARVKAGGLEARQEDGRMVVRRPAEIPTFDGTLSTLEVAAMLATHRNSIGPGSCPPSGGGGCSTSARRT